MALGKMSSGLVSLVPAQLLDLFKIKLVHTNVAADTVLLNLMTDFHTNPHNHYLVMRGSLSCLYLSYFELQDGGTHAMLCPLSDSSPKDIVHCVNSLGKLCDKEMRRKNIYNVKFGWEDGFSSAEKINRRIGTYLMQNGWTLVDTGIETEFNYNYLEFTRPLKS